MLSGIFSMFFVDILELIDHKIVIICIQLPTLFIYMYNYQLPPRHRPQYKTEWMFEFIKTLITILGFLGLNCIFQIKSDSSSAEFARHDVILRS